MDVAQCYGASSSYARKYALNGLFLIDDTKDADATNTHGKDKKWLNVNTPEFNKAKDFIKGGGSVEQIEAKYKLAKETRRMIEDIHRRNRKLRREGKFPQVIKDIKRK